MVLSIELPDARKIPELFAAEFAKFAADHTNTHTHTVTHTQPGAHRGDLVQAALEARDELAVAPGLREEVPDLLVLALDGVLGRGALRVRRFAAKKNARSAAKV